MEQRTRGGLDPSGRGYKSEIKIKQHQEEIYHQKDLDLQDRFAKNEIHFTEDKKEPNKILLANQRAYKSESQYPKGDLRPGKIYVDAPHRALLFPIGQKWLPLHISFVKSVSKNDEGQWSYLRLNLHTPGETTLKIQNMEFPGVKGPNGMYLRELTFKSSDSRSILTICKRIKDLIKKARQDDKETAENVDVTVSAPLKPNKDVRVLQDHLTIKPNLTGKKTNGTVEAFANGVRFTARDGQIVDINYDNVKHAFYQPCKDDLIVLIHFNLNRPMQIGGKKTNDIQFFMEAGNLVDDLDFRKKRYYNDHEELEMEQRERDNKKKLNKRFLKFSRLISDVAKKNGFNLEFDVPFTELSFTGAPDKSIVKVSPSVNNLVAL